MYIKKYWYNYIGGTDDSLTLVDYLYDKGKTEIPLSEIFNDTGLSKLNWNFHISPNLEYIDSEGNVTNFIMLLIWQLIWQHLFLRVRKVVGSI